MSRVRLLISVRDAAEARSAIAGGTDVIDVKEPSRGPLGRADDRVVREVVDTVRAARACPGPPPSREDRKSVV